MKFIAHLDFRLDRFYHISATAYRVRTSFSRRTLFSMYESNVFIAIFYHIPRTDRATSTLKILKYYNTLEFVIPFLFGDKRRKLLGHRPHADIAAARDRRR